MRNWLPVVISIAASIFGLILIINILFATAHKYPGPRPLTSSSSSR